MCLKTARQVLCCFKLCLLPIVSSQAPHCPEFCIWVHSRCPEKQGCASSKWCSLTAQAKILNNFVTQPLKVKQSPAPNNSGAVSWGCWIWFSWILGPRLWREGRSWLRTLSHWQSALESLETTVHHLDLFEKYHLKSWLFKDHIYLKHTHTRKGDRNSRGCEEWGLSSNSSSSEHMATWTLSTDGSQPWFLGCQRQGKQHIPHIVTASPAITAITALHFICGLLSCYL